MIYKIFRPAEWEALCATGRSAGAPVDIADGFIHFSTGTQVRETAVRHFADAGELVLAAADETRLGAALKWEPSRHGDLFPHLFRPLLRDDILWHRALRRGAAGHVFPDDLP